MKTFLLLLILLLGPSVALAQTANDEAALTALPQAFIDAWNRHDGHGLTVLTEPDVDFITVDGKWMRGQKDFETYHTRILGTRFRDSMNRVMGTNVRFLGPDLASVHYTWQITGATDDAGRPVPPRALRVADDGGRRHDPGAAGSRSDPGAAGRALDQLDHHSPGTTRKALPR